MSSRKPKVGDEHWGRKPGSCPDGMGWFRDGRPNENGNGRWVLREVRSFEFDDAPFFLPLELTEKTRSGRLEATQATFLNELGDKGKER